MEQSIQKQVMFVDDDPKFLDALGQLFTLMSQGTWQVHLATTSARALSILEQEHLDLVVSDMRMPVLDGGQLLQILEKQYPDVAKVVMTAYGSDELHSSVLEQGADLYLEKPRQAEEYETLFASLNFLLESNSTRQSLPTQRQDPGANETIPGRRIIEEVVVCSGRDEVLYSWSCPDLEAKLKLIHLVQQKSDWVGREWRLGAFDRLEIEGPLGRIVTQIQPDRKLWVRSATEGVVEKEAGS